MAHAGCSLAALAREVRHLVLFALWPLVADVLDRAFKIPLFAVVPAVGPALEIMARRGSRTCCEGSVLEVVSHVVVRKDFGVCCVAGGVLYSQLS